MNSNPPEGNVVHANIGEFRTGDQSQIAIGANIHQENQPINTSEEVITKADRAALEQLMAKLKAYVAAKAPPEKQQSALERVDELEEAIAAKEPDLTTMEYVTKWFAKHLPALSGAVASVVVNPIVGKVVEAAGEMVATEFRQKFKRS